MLDTCPRRESRDGQGHNRDKTIPLDLPEFKFLVRNLDAITDVQMTHHRYEDPSIDVYITWGFPVEKHKQTDRLGFRDIHIRREQSTRRIQQVDTRNKSRESEIKY